MTLNATGRVFTATFATSATTGAVDLISLLSTAASKFVVRALDVFAISTSPETVGIELWRTTGSSASTGQTTVPRNVRGHTGAPAAVTGCNGPGTVPLTTGANAAKLFQGALAPDGFRYRPEVQERPEFTTNAPRFHARISAPTTTVTLVGTVTFEEIGRNPSS